METRHTEAGLQRRPPGRSTVRTAVAPGQQVPQADCHVGPAEGADEPAGADAEWGSLSGKVRQFLIKLNVSLETCREDL